ncbi:hypothetical protein DFJ73DRAFT_759850 [Zopfochytrium polystomum]|nr:hypothetical protein DFJ73DRAFT_759850 [Zopfochytrium polystomum]
MWKGLMTIGHLLLQHLCWTLLVPPRLIRKADDSTAASSADSALAGSSMANAPSQIASSTGGSTGGASSSLDSGPSTPTASLDVTAEAWPKRAAATTAEAAWNVAHSTFLRLCIVSGLLQQKALERCKPHQQQQFQISPAILQLT